MQAKKSQDERFLLKQEKNEDTKLFQKIMLSIKIFFSMQMNRTKEITIQILLVQYDKKSETLGVFSKRLLKLFPW